MTGASSIRPLVSVIVPVYNVERYLERCMKALCNQTLREIEIIAVNDGSSDSSGEILAAFARADERVRVIDKPNSGYGASMNRGLDEARGVYIGIVEPDDYPDRVMFQKLVRAAERHDADVVKCNYYLHFEDHEEIHWNLHGFGYGRAFDPADEPRVVCTAPTVWTGLYRAAFLKRCGIRFRETPGAAFQDAAFSLKVWFSARRCVFLRRPMLHYRADNPASSSKTTDKVFTVCEELEDAKAYLDALPERAKVFGPWFHVGKWGKYRWNYERIDASVHEQFAERMRREYLKARESGELDMALFEPNSRRQVSYLLDCGAAAFAARYPESFPFDGDPDDLPPSFGVGDVPAGPSPAVSVIVPVYNCESYVEQCLDSLKAQTFGDFEALVVDDASTDGSLARIRACTEGDERFSVFAQLENGGLSASRNVGLAHAAGEYVVFLDGDDYLVPDALGKLVSKARAQKLDDLYFSAQSFYDELSLTETMDEDFSARPDFDGVVTGRELYSFFVERDQFFTQAALRMVRRGLLEDEGIRFKEGILHEDVLFTFQVVAASKRSSLLNEPLYCRRLRAGSITGSRWTAENVRGHFVGMQEIKRWMAAHASELDDAFMAAVGKQLALWCRVCAEKWQSDVSDADKASFIASLGAADKIDFYHDILGGGGEGARIREEFAQSTSYKLGSALLAGPRVARNRMRALSVIRGLGK